MVTIIDNEIWETIWATDRKRAYHVSIRVVSPTEITGICTCYSYYYQRGTDANGFCKHLRELLKKAIDNDFFAVGELAKYKYDYQRMTLTKIKDDIELTYRLVNNIDKQQTKAF